MSAGVGEKVGLLKSGKVIASSVNGSSSTWLRPGGASSPPHSVTTVVSHLGGHVFRRYPGGGAATSARGQVTMHARENILDHHLIWDLENQRETWKKISRQAWEP